jgi:hypothetical protein
MLNPKSIIPGINGLSENQTTSKCKCFFVLSAKTRMFFIGIVISGLIQVLCSQKSSPVAANQKKLFVFNPSAMTNYDTVGRQYCDTIRLDSTSDKFTFALCNSDTAIKLKDTIITWIPAQTDTGIRDIRIIVLLNSKPVDTISWPMTIYGNWPSGCASYTHKYDVQEGQASSLPDGYFIYAPYAQSGINKSPIHQFVPKRIPNTYSDQPGNISISDDGKWICYVDRSRNRICLITINGCYKTIAPIASVDPGFPTIAGFYRRSPFGSEIFYNASTRVLRSITVNLSNQAPQFGSDRSIVSVSPNYFVNSDDFIQMSVVGNQIFGEICPVINNTVIYRTAFMTIPNNGQGTAGDADIYQWKNDSDIAVYGCGHTQTHDGTYCLANAGPCGSPSCVPQEHNGFYVTHFYHVSDQPVNMVTDYLDKYASSINWCPEEYQNYNNMSMVDFWGWYFGNRDDYVIGRQLGSLGQNGIWMVDWPTNTWYRLTPVEQNILTLQPAVFFYSDSIPGITDSAQCMDDTSESPLPYDPTTDWFNPHLHVVRPNGGETYAVGEQCTVQVSASRPGSDVLYLSVDDGKSFATLPGFTTAINPFSDTIAVFTIPDSIESGAGQESTISDKCLIEIRDYGNSNYYDISDSTFSITTK